MFSTLRNRFGIPGVISVIALVFAMFGGAYAASNSSGGGKATASAKTKKGPRGPKGATGPAGAQGPAGPAGPAGAKGDAGTAGSNGTPGTPGAPGTSVTNTALSSGNAHCSEGGAEFKVGAGSPTYACNGNEGVEGLEGPEGPEGKPWTAGGTLPPGKSEYGAFSAGPLLEGQAFVYEPISFGIPLTSGPAVHFMAQGATPTTPCPGTFEAPKAAPGNLCLYRSEGTLEFQEEAEENPETAIAGEGAGKAGVNLRFFGEEFQSARGVWVVTAPGAP